MQIIRYATLPILALLLVSCNDIPLCDVQKSAMATSPDGRTVAYTEYYACGPIVEDTYHVIVANTGNGKDKEEVLVYSDKTSKTREINLSWKNSNSLVIHVVGKSRVELDDSTSRFVAISNDISVNIATD